MKEQNQCDGCKRGLPIKNGDHYDERFCVMGCTKDPYASPIQQKSKDNRADCIYCKQKGICKLHKSLDASNKALESFKKEGKIYDYDCKDCAQLPFSCSKHMVKTAPEETQEPIAYSSSINLVRPVLAEYLNNWENDMLVDLAVLIEAARIEGRGFALEEVIEIVSKIYVGWSDRTEGRDSSYDDAFEDGYEVTHSRILAALSALKEKPE